MKILILLLLVVSPSLNAPVEEYDVSHLKKPEHGVQGHSHTKLGREAKWTFNYEPGDITVDDVSGGDFSIGHSAKISIGDSSPQLINEAAGLPGLPDLALPNPTLPECDGGPSLLSEDCFCKKTDGSGVLCPRNSRCYRGICSQPSKNPCSFDDNLLKPNLRQCEGCSPQDLSAKFQWSDNTIVYYYGNEDTLEADKNFIRSVMDDIEERTCFKFDGIRSKAELEADEVHRLEIYIKSDTTLDCFDNAGNVGNLDRFGNLKLTLETSVTVPYGEEGCQAAGLVIHELMHAVGVAHTQKREDRKNHIQVKMENLNLDYKSQYEICADCKLHDEIPYDCGSIMHYGTHENSNDGVSQVIVAEPEEIDPENDTTGTCDLRKFSNLKYVSTASEVSDKDWELLNLIGNCPSRKRKRSAPKTIVNGTIIFPNGTNVQFPEKSSVHVLCRNITQLPAITIATDKIDVSNRMSTEGISYELEADFENLDSSVIMLATINVGWERDASNWIRSGDFYNNVSHPLDITANTSQYQKDIKVELYISP